MNNVGMAVVVVACVCAPFMLVHDDPELTVAEKPAPVAPALVAPAHAPAPESLAQAPAPAPAQSSALDALLKSSSGPTRLGAFLLASQQLCGYWHDTLKEAVLAVKREGADDQKVLDIAYLLNQLGEGDAKAKQVICDKAFQII